MLGDVTAEAKVAWRTDQAGSRADQLPTGLGLTFVDVSVEGKNKIRQYIQKFCQLATQLGQHAV